MRRVRRTPRANLPGVASVVLALLLLAGLMPRASAHDYLVSSTPAAGSTQRSQPGTVNLTFDDIVLASKNIPNRVRVSGPGGRYYETGCAAVLGRVVKVPVRLGAAGRYTVDWRIVSSDGHPVSNHIAFTYRPAAGAPSTGGTARTTCVMATTRETPAAGGQTRTTSSRAPLMVVGAVAVLAVIALLALFVRGRTDPTDAGEHDDHE